MIQFDLNCQWLQEWHPHVVAMITTLSQSLKQVSTSLVYLFRRMLNQRKKSKGKSKSEKEEEEELNQLRKEIEEEKKAKEEVEWVANELEKR